MTIKYTIKIQYIKINYKLKIVLINAGRRLISFEDERIRSKLRMRNSSFLGCLNKKQNVLIDSPASSGALEKYIKYVGFQWPPFETAVKF